MSEGGPIRRRQGMAMGQGNIGYGHMGAPTGGRNPGFAKGGHVAKGNHHVPTAGHHNMDGHIGHGAHGHGHKAHGHTQGVPMQGGQKAGGVGSGGASSGTKQDACHGPSDNQFGSHMPSGGTLGRW